MSAQPPFLSDDEIREIVTPLTQPAAIVRWFRANGFPDCRVRPNGLPLITRAQFDAVSAGQAGQQPDTASDDLDLTAYLKKFGKGPKSKAHH